MSSNVLNFPQRKSAPAPEASPMRSSLRSAPDADQLGEPPSAEVKEMFKQSAAMTLIATLAFYAGQGWDGGKKAREAMPAMKELMATKGIQLVLPS